MTNDPTDAELTEVYRAANGEDTGKAQPLTTKRIFRAMRAAITKWGTPVLAGEPYGYVYVVQVAPVVGDERKVIQTFFTQKSRLVKRCRSTPPHRHRQPPSKWGSPSATNGSIIADGGTDGVGGSAKVNTIPVCQRTSSTTLKTSMTLKKCVISGRFIATHPQPSPRLHGEGRADRPQAVRL